MKYITIYNSIALLICFTGLSLTIKNIISRNSINIFYIGLCQLFFVIEFFNVIFKKSNSFLLATFVQNFSRNFVIWYICYFHQIVSRNYLFDIMIMSWYISDTTRYLYYLFRSEKIKWMRYNLFIVLYPIGTFLEIVLTNGVYLLSGSFGKFALGTIMLCYLPGFGFLYYHMWKQRKITSKRGQKKKKN